MDPTAKEAVELLKCLRDYIYDTASGFLTVPYSGVDVKVIRQAQEDLATLDDFLQRVEKGIA